MWLHRPCRQSRNSSVECGRGFSFDMAPVVLSWPTGLTLAVFLGSLRTQVVFLSCACFLIYQSVNCWIKQSVQIDSEVSNLWMCLWKVKKQDSRLNVIVMCAVIFEILYPACVDRNVCLYNVCIFEKELGIFSCSALCFRNRLLFILLFRATKRCLISFYYSYIFQTKRPSCCCGNHWPLSV